MEKLPATEPPAAIPSDGIKVSPQLRGETIAYAVQNGVYNLAANFFEPYVGYRVQKHYANPRTHAYGSYSQNLAGEFAGDVSGSGTLIAAELLFPNQLHAFTRMARGWVDPFYTSVAHKVLARERNQPDYNEQVEQWKTFQERNLVRSLIMVPAAIAGNIGIQKAIGNPSPGSVILKGKLASAALTTALGLTIRFAFPDQTKQADSWLSRHVFSPMLQNGQAGAVSHTDKVLKQRDETPPPQVH